MSGLSLAQAQIIVSAALEHARANTFQKIAVAVLDARGSLKAYAAEDGTSLKRDAVARGKAFAAVSLGVGSRALHRMAGERPHFIGAMNGVVDGPFIPVPGGVLVRDATGALLGAVGISGDTSDNDEAAAMAGIAKAGLVGDPGQ
jgi:uncharacterized protein GlcG (DUF336 family)